MRALISGGGTGGHIFPALAVARALTDLDGTVEILYVGRAGGMEEEIVAASGLDIEGLRIRGVQPEAWRNLPLAYALPASVLRASSLISHFKPSVVFGTGGYVVGPVGAAATIRRVPLYLQVPDAVPGRTIRLLGPRARTVFSAYEETGLLLRRTRTQVSGTPVRGEFIAAAAAKPPIQRLRNILVFGGSQGAHRINTAVAEAIKGLLGLDDLHVHHLCGEADHDGLRGFRSGLPEAVRERYRLEPFNPDLVDALAAADLVVARAGGSSIAEMTVLGLPMILVPYPHAGGHQLHNARPIADAGAAVLVPDEELSGVRLLAEVTRLARDPGRLAAMAEASRGLGRPDAARVIARALLEAA